MPDVETNAPDRRSRGRPRSWDDKTEQNTIKSLDRAIDVLEHVSQSQGRTLSEIASGMGQSAATVYRVLVTLSGRGIVDFVSEDQTWHVGPQAFIIGARFLRRSSLVEHARPILRQLMEQTGETANLGIERDGQVLFLSQVETQENIRAFFAPGTLSPMHASGIGKALLSQMDRNRITRILGTAPLEGFTKNTITSLPALEIDLEQSRTRGYALDSEEKSIGMQCIAAPVFDVNREAVAGISVSGPTSRIGAGDIERLQNAVTNAAKTLSHTIGG